MTTLFASHALDAQVAKVVGLIPHPATWTPSIDFDDAMEAANLYGLFVDHLLQHTSWGWRIVKPRIVDDVIVFDVIATAETVCLAICGSIVELTK